MKIKTAELTGLALDWALAVAMGLGPDIGRHCYARYVQYTDHKHNIVRALSHTDPAMCMRFIEGEKINIKHMRHSTDNRAVLACWGSVYEESGYVQTFGSNTPEAVARCVVQMRLGDVVEIPDELVGG